MEGEGSMFETSEMAANYLASTNILPDSWNTCNYANSPVSEGFVINQNGPVGLVGFSGLKYLRHGLGPNLKDMVGLQDGPFNGLFPGPGRYGADGDDHDEPVMVHAGLLGLFLGVYGTPSFQTQMKILLEKSKSIIITGHSIGGALASLTALWLLSYHQSNATPSPPRILCITFGSPLLGNKPLSKSLLRHRWAGNFCHVVYKHDIVPRLLFAPLDSLHIHLHVLLQYIQSSMNSQFTNIPLRVSDEMKSQLFGFASAYTDAVEKCADWYSDAPAQGVFWPFGSYLLCADEGAICVDNSGSVVRLMHLMMGTSDPGSCLEDHLKYGGCVEKLSFQFLMNKGYLQVNVPNSSYDAGLALAVESLGLARQESVFGQAKHSLQTAKQVGVTPNLNSARLAITLAKITPHRAQIEWYKTCCDNSDSQLGYYDSFKQRQASKRDNQVNMFRIKLANFWDSVIEKIDNNELPHDFHKRRKFINASHFYQLLVEPLDIAEYYRSGEHQRRGHYLSNGRDRRHEVFSKWWREREVVEDESKRSKFASQTQDSCFWARVEEARELVKKVRTERNARNLDRLWQGIDRFERYARELVENKEVSCDVVARNSSYSLWVEEVTELRSQMRRTVHQLPADFLGGEMVP
ncbi:hypothetical protein RND81_04G211200 [Saponaria officinalis]|uniref:Lipase-like PAD4 n=1 Tax=Saponaria officinalis TaxID=3572 RepID=A0AAW1LPB2_SAPOF